jgi:glycosyltransferase involved in cell wall biosynthesis
MPGSTGLGGDQGGPDVSSATPPVTVAGGAGTLSPADRSQALLLAVLVDNQVVGDSRVQKCALAAAAAGYRVVLVGRAPAGADTFTLGPDGAQVEVRRLDAPYRMLALTRRVPGHRWRYPLAYPSADHSAARQLRLNAVAADLRARKLLLRRSGLAGTRARSQDVALKAITLGQRVKLRWHQGRALQLKWAVDRVKAADSPGYRLGSRLRATVRGDGAWRALDPVLLDLELAFGPALDALAPDLIHANDFRMSGVAVRAAARAWQAGRRVPVVYDVHEFVPGVVSRSVRWRIANTTHEAEYIRHADAVITVSDRLAEMLQERYRLAVRPRVVLNAPQFDPDNPDADGPDVTAGGVRAACGLAEGVPLLVYGGSAAPQRGLETAVDALPELAGTHLALVLADPARGAELTRRAAALGVADRLHVLDYVPQDQVVPLLRSATAGIIPIHHVPNHEIALITKYFEYAHARLPIITSDTETMGGRTREVGNGEVFVAQDVADFVRAARAVIADPQRYRDAYDRDPELLQGWSWDQQKAVLLDVYAGALRAVGVQARAG